MKHDLMTAALVDVTLQIIIIISHYIFKDESKLRVSLKSYFHVAGFKPSA